MTDDSKSNGPYSAGGSIRVFDTDVDWGIETCVEAHLMNVAYAEGRKAMEKDFQELLELAKDMREFITDECLDSRKVVAGDFDAWKKARGLV